MDTALKITSLKMRLCLLNLLVLHLELTFNHDYVADQRQDQLLTSWLLSSINHDLLSQFVGHDSAHGIWKPINELCAT